MEIVIRLLERWFDTRKLEGDLFGKKDTREERVNKTKEGERSGG